MKIPNMELCKFFEEIFCKEFAANVRSGEANDIIRLDKNKDGMDRATLQTVDTYHHVVRRFLELFGDARPRAAQYEQC